MLRQLRESGGIEHREVGKHFPIEPHPGSLQSMNQLSVRQAIQPRGGADALNPQFAVFALFDAAIAERIAIRAIRGLLRGLVELAFGEKKALCALEILLTAGAALCA